MIEPHVCRESRTCCCSISALEPADHCPIHGAGRWPPQCEVCGRFMAWQAARDRRHDHDGSSTHDYEGMCD